jgi:hypothetical protein
MDYFCSLNKRNKTFMSALDADTLAQQLLEMLRMKEEGDIKLGLMF